MHDVRQKAIAHRTASRQYNHAFRDYFHNQVADLPDDRFWELQAVFRQEVCTFRFAYRRSNGVEQAAGEFFRKVLANDFRDGIRNHDYGLCHDPDAEVRGRYSDAVLDYMTSLKPRLEIDGCLFQHVEHWLNPEDLMDLWYFEGLPDTSEKIARIFRSGQHRIMFAGHFHRWLHVTPQGITDWSGGTPITLSRPERHYVVVGALCEGRFATFDTKTFELVPFA